MTQRNLRTVFKKQWGNSILSVNLKYWRCIYCGLPIKDDKPFGIVRINGNLIPDIFCTEHCLKTHIIKLEAQRTD
jgi:hypothetical protein